MKIVITGASGFIGKKLVASLRSAGHTASTIGRGKQSDYQWGVDGSAPVEPFDGADAVIHLAGEPVAQRWNPEVKKQIADSRIVTTEKLVQAMSIADPRPRTLVCASAVGYYGDRGEEPLAERAKPGTGFLPDVCVRWEEKADLAAALGVRVVKVRIGIVLGEGGGALEQMLPPFKAFAGGRLGDGKQWMPWIHLDDIVGIFQFAVENDVKGALNGVAPGAVRNAEFTAALGKRLGRPAFLSVPEFALRAMYGEMAAVMLGSQRVVPEATVAAGYHFRHPQLPEALASLKL